MYYFNIKKNLPRNFSTRERTFKLYCRYDTEDMRKKGEKASFHK